MLKSLNLQNFRNYSKKTFGFSPEITLVVGPNAVGKTNVLEAIYLLATGKSFRAEKEVELILEGADFFRIFGETDKVELELICQIGQIGRHMKALKVNGVNRRQMDFVGNLYAVLFSPQDIEIVTESPAVRRKYLDLVLSQIFKDYRVASSIYERALRQRNRLLKRIRDEGISREQLTYWDELLISNGKILHERRREYLIYMSNLSNLLFPIALTYEHSIISKERLAKYASEEISAGTTLVGPHRDDFRIWNEKREVRLFGSRGEQRMATFELKLGELAFIKEKTGEEPILLLDDVFSELDHENRHLLLEVIPKQQTIMTTTDFHLVEKEFLKDVEVIEL